MDLTGGILFFISSGLFVIAINSKNSYIAAFAIIYSFLALPLIFATGA